MLDGHLSFFARLLNGFPRQPFLTATLVLACGAQICALPNAQTLNADDNIIAEYDVRPGGDMVALPVKIHGKDYPFCVGTSSVDWVFDESLRTYLRPIDSRVAANSQGAKLFAAPAATIGPFPVPSGSRGLCTPFRTDMAANGEDVYGGIGFNFLSDKIFTIDFDRGKLAFLRSAGRNRGEAFQLDLVDDGHGPRPLLTVDLPTGPERFRVCASSAGFNAGSIAHAKFAPLLKQGWLSLISERGKKYVGVGGGWTRSGRLASFALGRFKHEKLLFDDSELSSLDLGYLSRYIVTFDFPNRIMYLRPGKNYDRIDHEYNPGLAIVRTRGLIDDGADAAIGEVVPGGAAEVAGLKVFDEILSVDGLTTARTSLFEIMRVLATPGRHDIEYVRDNKQLRTTIAIEDDLRELPLAPEGR